MTDEIGEEIQDGRDEESSEHYMEILDSYEDLETKYTEPKQYESLQHEYLDI